MIIKQEILDRAKTEAIEYLEYSIYTLSILAGVDPQDIDAQWIAATESQISSASDAESQEILVLKCLLTQVKAYSKIASIE